MWDILFELFNMPLSYFVVILIALSDSERSNNHFPTVIIVTNEHFVTWNEFYHVYYSHVFKIPTFGLVSFVNFN